MSVSYGGDSITFADGSVTSSGWTGFKNRLINGEMRISQRYGSANTTLSAGAGGAATYTLDRWLIGKQDGAAANVSISTDAPAGFTNSIKIMNNGTNTSANTMFFYQKIEGTNCSDLAFGTASAKTLTLSFWVKSSSTGTLNAYFFNNAVDRSYIAPFTILATDTWEYKTIVIPGDVGGVWTTDSSTFGLQVSFALGGSTNSSFSSGTINQWFTGTKYIYTGNSNWNATSGANIYFTGVQLEKGSTASSFEYRPYTIELQLCQRYYEVMGASGVIWFITYSAYSSGSLGNSTPWKVQKAKTPAVTTGTQYAITLTPYDWGFQLYSTTGGYVSPYVIGTIIANAEF